MITANPVFRKELLMRLRFRQWSARVRIGVSIGIIVSLGIIYWLLFKLLIDHSDAAYGRTAFGVCIVLQHIVVCLISPIIAANAITKEKEQQTWEMLVATRLTPIEIIMGKLIARLIIIFILLLLFFPITLFSWAHWVVLDLTNTGNSPILILLMSYAMLIVCTIFFGTIGLFLSWLMRRTLYVILLSYTIVIGGLLIGTGLISSALPTTAFSDKNPLLWINPAMMCSEALSLSTFDDRSGTIYLFYGLFCYILMTLLMIWRMTIGFRRFAYDK